jgi:hypothetical protein
MLLTPSARHGCKIYSGCWLTPHLHSAIVICRYQAIRFLRRWCMPRFATSFDRVRRARFCVWPATGRFDRSGGPFVRRSVSSQSRSSNSSRQVGVIDSFPLSYSLRRTRRPGLANDNRRCPGLCCFLVIRCCSIARSLGIGLRCGVGRGVAKLLQNVSRFAAEQCDVALTIDTRQIHPNSQLPRPHFAGDVVGLAAHGQ